MRQMFAVFLAILLANASIAQPAFQSSKEMVLKIPAGSPVEVRLTDNTKLRGRLGNVSDTGFELQAVKNGKVDTVQVAFDQLKSIKNTGKESFGHSLGKGFLIGGIVVGAIFLVSVIFVAATGGITN